MKKKQFYDEPYMKVFLVTPKNVICESPALGFSKYEEETEDDIFDN